MKSTDAVDYRHNTKTKGTIFNVISFDGDVQDSFFPNVHAPFYFSLCISVNSFFALFPIFIFFFLFVQRSSNRKNNGRVYHNY